MSTPVTLILSDQVYQQAKGLATQTGRSVADLLTRTIERSLLLYPQVSNPTTVSTDNSVLTPSTESERLTEELYGLVKRTSSYEELDELYHEQ